MAKHYCPWVIPPVPGERLPSWNLGTGGKTGRRGRSEVHSWAVAGRASRLLLDAEMLVGGEGVG